MPSRLDLGPKPQLGYTDSILSRVAERRSDDAFLAACKGDTRAATFAIGGELVVMKKGRGGADPGAQPRGRLLQEGQFSRGTEGDSLGSNESNRLLLCVYLPRGLQ